MYWSPVTKSGLKLVFIYSAISMAAIFLLQ